jgi:Regulator of chromosome condensation (RCC1) repeat
MTMRHHLLWGPTLLLAVCLSACGDDTTGGDPIPAEIRLLSDPLPTGTAAWPLADPVIVEVLDEEGNPLSGVTVSWTVGDDAGQVVADADTTNVAGRASAEWTLGVAEGEQVLSAAAGDLDPVTVRATSTVFHATSVAVGDGFACALASGGQAFCWGDNFAGQLGIGTVGGDMTSVPQPVEGALSFDTLSASGSHLCGLTADGTAYCWGSNMSGESGSETAGAPVPVPTPVQTALRFTQVSSEGLGHGDGSTCAITSAGEAWCWGDNKYGKLGDGTTTASAIPVRVESDVSFTRIESGYFHVCATAEAGELYCWGEQESDPGPFNARPAGIYLPLPVSEGFMFEDLSMGRNFTCGLAPEGRVLCWGSDIFGSLGSDVPESAVPLEVEGGIAFRSVSPASMEENHALSADGTLYRWGSIGNDNVQRTPLAVTPDVAFSVVESGGWPFPPEFGANGACGTVGEALYCVRDDGLVRGVPQPGTGD